MLHGRNMNADNEVHEKDLGKGKAVSGFGFFPTLQAPN